ncbi:alpha-hydroxy acid oxidase [Zeimonas arvi]|uniref:alpha-hydroxy acid oxidase n=1 Tax=Zeimonas arvi TaxID=2498847 RepID=UPI001CEC78F1|nr:alpha-hydroxy acid oxidase [Zeimonas arvi]
MPEGIHCAQDYEALASRFLDAPVHAYVAGGSGRERTIEANSRAFDELGIQPRVLRDARAGHTRLTLLGRELAHPVLLAPVAFQALAHPQAERATAQGAAATDTCIVASTLSSCSLEAIATEAGPERWFQLYLQPRREDTLELVRRAEAAGYGALVVTLDAPAQAPSLRALRAGFRLPDSLQPANLATHPPAPPLPTAARGASRIFQGIMAQAPGWRDLPWLLGQTRLPVLAKGVLHPCDAKVLKRAGVAGLVVSNHGGRALDGAQASIDALPAIRQAVGDDYPLLLDGGIRAGDDVFKAIALGADAVMIGRLQVYALAAAGALGVAHLIKLLREELELCMALAGCPTLADIGETSIHRWPRPALVDHQEHHAS